MSVIDWLTKSVHILPIMDNMIMKQLGKLYVREIVRLHGVPKKFYIKTLDLCQPFGKVFKSF